ncbi:hypothetical protein [Arcobacter vandammei]|uniref:hypothetical protein n=2 Tax=Arcobacter vandammei TaxID=2782243 RepID=UPI0018E026AE|nr:hypothetical protein [Arcobacter vandammei]
MTNLFFVLLLWVFVFVQNIIFTKNDNLSLILYFVSCFFIFIALFERQKALRKATRIIAKEDSKIFHWFSKHSIISFVISIIFSIVTSFVLLYIFKGISYDFNIFNNFLLFIVMVAINVLVFNISMTKKWIPNSLEDNLKSEVTDVGNNFLRIFLGAVISSFILAITISYNDTNSFVSSNQISLNNFDELTLENKIISNGSNDISRQIVTTYILLDNFKLAFANEIVDIFLDNDRKHYFSLFYFMISVLNFIKFFTLSISYLLLQQGLIIFCLPLIRIFGRKK